MKTTEEMKFDIVPQNAAITPDARETIQAGFSEPLQAIAEWKEKLPTITDPVEARIARLALVKVRTSADSIRKTMKEDSLRESNAIQGAYNIILAVVVPMENQMETIERAEQRRIEAELLTLIQDRRERLDPYIEPGEFLPDIGRMTIDQFNAYLSDKQKLAEIKAVAIAKAEQARIERERKEAAEREAQRLENIRLREEAEARENAMRAEREEMARKTAEAEKARQAELDRLAKETAARIKKESAERAKIEAAAKAEREAREKAQREVQALRDADAKRIADEQAAEKAKAAADALAAKKAAAAPDREKILAFAEKVRALGIPIAATIAGKQIADYIGEKLVEFADWVESQAERL